MAAKKRSTADFYASNPESYKKKLAYDKKRTNWPGNAVLAGSWAKEVLT